MKKDIYNQYCIRVMHSIGNEKYFITFVYADSITVRCYSDGKTWFHFYNNGALVMTAEGDKCRITAKRVLNAEYADTIQIDYDYCV